jgi:hypothetical protein
MIGWATAFGLVEKQWYTMLGTYGRAKPLISWPGSKKRKGLELISPLRGTL